MRHFLRYRKVSVACWAALFSSVILSASYPQTPTEAFARGNELYRKGQFQEALKEYESILAQGYVSADLYFNIGNSYYRLGKIAPAIVAYERANRLRPNDPDVLYNLKLVNLRTIDRIEAVPELFVFQWLRVLSGAIARETTTVLFAAGWSLFFLSLATMYAVRRSALVERVRWLVLTGFLGSLVFGGMLGLQYWETNATKDQSIISAPAVTAKSSPDDQSMDAFVIHEGLKVRTSDRVGDWLKIILPDGKVGWIRSNQCEQI